MNAKDAILDANASVSDPHRSARYARDPARPAERLRAGSLLPERETDERLPDPELAPGATPSSRMDEGALPKGWRPGCGCLCLLLPYYLIGLSLMDNFRWEHDWPRILAYVLGPFLWPVLLAGWMPHPVLQIPVALAAIFAYWYWIRAAWKADDLKWTFLNLLWIVLLLLGSVGGCAMAFDRSFKF